MVSGRFFEIIRFFGTGNDSGMISCRLADRPAWEHDMSVKYNMSVEIQAFSGGVAPPDALYNVATVSPQTNLNSALVLHSPFAGLRPEVFVRLLYVVVSSSCAHWHIH
jgi:hypothetical protein